MERFDLSPLFRSTIGFDRLSELLDSVMREESPGYPPYNIERRGEDDYRIVMAVPGCRPDDIEIVQEPNVLAVRARIPEPENASYLHRGITPGSIERHFRLADHIEVQAARLENGLLSIELHRELPEALRPRRIEIRSGSPKAIGTEVSANGQADAA